MALIIAFLLGMANFAAQRAVLESGHPVLRAIVPGLLPLARLGSLGLEFTLLVAAMWAAERGLSHWLALYGVYSFANGFAAWMIAGRRI